MSEAARRWSGSLGLAALIHAGLLALGLGWAASAPNSSGAPVLAVELALAPAQPPATPEPPEPQPEPPRPEPPKPAPKPEAVKPPPKPAPRPVPKPVVQPAEPAVAAPTAAPTAPPAPADAVDKATAAPTPGADAATRAAVTRTWQGELLGRLERVKRYPRAAEVRRREGVAVVGFVLDREGNLLEARLVRSSGDAALDAEALALPERARPLPPPPEHIGGARIEVVAPVRFTLRR